MREVIGLIYETIAAPQVWDDVLAVCDRARSQPPVRRRNKRTAYVALESCLRLNGCRFPVSDAEATVATLQLAAEELSDEEFVIWLRQNAMPRPVPRNPLPNPSGGSR
ncbi:MAG: hypothetical protein ABI224_03230 [Acetobacteraceae bacterium]